METRRLFIAFPIDIDHGLAAAIKKTKIGAQQKEMEFNWVPSANFHVTLNFIGETEIERIPEIEAILENIASETATFDTSLRGMGAFPDERHMRTLWIGVRKSRSLAGLRDRVREALTAAGFIQEDREYVPHLTIGRLRKARTGGDLISPYVRTSFGDVDIKSFVLYESVQQGSHPVYKVIRRFDLTGADEVAISAEEVTV